MITLIKKLFFIFTLLVLAGCGGSGSSSSSSSSSTSSSSSGSTTTVKLVAYQPWHGLASHNKKDNYDFTPYDSRDPVIIAKHIEQAQAMGIEAFIVNWYGPASGVANDEDRAFIDQATTELFKQAEEKDFHVALMYDEGTVWEAEQPDTSSFITRAQSDLDYAKQYFDSPAYLEIEDEPALFIFPYDSPPKMVDQYIDWAIVRGELGVEITLIDKDPNPGDPAHDNNFDGFYGWVYATNGNWKTDGSEWGEEYMNWFYATMQSASYEDKVAIGGVWPGFDDVLAAWGEHRFISRRGRQTYDDTMGLATQNAAPYVLIGTWNDFEEGTDIEFGIENVVDMDDEDQDLFTSSPLVRSWPLQVHWNADRGPLTLQVYKDGSLIHDQQHSPGVALQLQSGNVYEIKIWTSGTTTKSRWVIIRGQDHIPGIDPVVVDAWSFAWSGDKILADAEFLNPAQWVPNQADYDSGDRSNISSDGNSLQLNWTFGNGDGYKWVQTYRVLPEPISLEHMDIFAIDIKGSALSDEVAFELKFEDGTQHAFMKWDNIAGLERWGNRLAIKKQQFWNANLIDWTKIKVISLAVSAAPSVKNISGTLSVRNLVATGIDDWQTAVAPEYIQHETDNQIADGAINAIINRQTSVGLLTTWTEDNSSWLYGQGLALKALCLAGEWDQQNPVNAAAEAAEKLALFLANNQHADGYWPRTWNALSGQIINLVESNNTIWMGDFPWPLIGLQSYHKKTGDQRVQPAIDNALLFIKSLINASTGELHTLNVQTSQQEPVTSSEAIAAVLLGLYESNETQLAETMWNHVLNNNWDDELNLWKEGTGGHRIVLFGNTWLAPFLYQSGKTQMALDSLSLVSRTLYTNGPGAPYGLDGIVPLAVWYEGTLSYIAAGGPGSVELFDNLKDYINADGTVPHYNENLGVMGGIWAVDWASLDGTSWLYFAASGQTPFDALDP